MAEQFTAHKAVIRGLKATTATKRKVEIDYTPPRQVRAAPDLGREQPWVVAMHEPNRLQRAMVALSEAGYLPFAPMITRWRRKGYKQTKAAYPLFPGYIFVPLVAGPSKPVAGCHCVVKVISDHLGPLHIKAQQIHDLSEAMLSGAFDETLTPDARFKIGQKVDINAGPFLSLSGVITALAGADSAKVMLNFFGAEREATISMRHLFGSASV